VAIPVLVRSCGVRATTLAASAHQDLPFEELVATLERERALEPAALAQVIILLQNAYSERRTQARFRGGQSEYAVASGDGNDIRCYLDASGKRSWAGVYKLHLFRATAIDRLLRDFRKVLERMLTPAGATNVDNPDLRE
jgi:non-ribosomal peptide synthetase component F